MSVSSGVPILEGAEFRELWEERLTPEGRRSVRRAVRRGEPLEDQGLASVAVSLARRYQRLPGLAVVIGALITAFWIWLFVWLLSIPVGGSVVFWRFLAGSWVLLLPLRLGIFLAFQRPRYREAEAANLRRLHGNMM